MKDSRPGAIVYRTSVYVFCIALGVLVLTTVRFGSPTVAQSALRQGQAGDELSPGFFNPPPGVKPINQIMPRLHARESYAWQFRGGSRQLVAFSTPIQHIVIIYMENRTPEDLFGAFFASTNPTTGNTFGTDLKLVNPNSLSPVLSPRPLTAPGDPSHKHYGAFYNEATNGVWPTNDPNKSGYYYVPTSGPSPSVMNYITLIENWAYNNSTLESNEGPSFISHQYAIAGQSGGLTGSEIAPNGMTENPTHNGNGLPGNGTCFTSSVNGQTVDSINMNSPYPTPSPSPATFVASPCVEYSTILDHMASAAPTTSPYYLWQYIAMDDQSIWSAPMAIHHLYNAYSADPNPSKTGQPFAVDPDAENFVLNVTSSTSPTPNPARPFAELTYITPCLGESDHPNNVAPGGNSFDDGPDWLAYVLNAIGSSPYWNNTAVVITWDDWGGYYDNFSPSPWPRHPSGNVHDPNEWGFRVPLIVVSPWVKSKGYISSTLISQGAILNFVENTFGLPSHVLGGDDSANGSNDLTDMLYFGAHMPMPWTALPTNFHPRYHKVCPSPSPSP